LITRLDNTTALLLIDLQQGFDNPVWGQRNNPEAERQIVQILAAWRRRQRPILHVQHLSTLPTSPLRPGQAGCEFKPEVQPFPNEPTIQKTVNSAFIGTNLEAELRQRQISSLVVAGLTTDHCVSTSTRMAANLGFPVWLVSDATATFDRISPTGKHYSAAEMHDTALTSLQGEFATIVTTAELLVAL
jgi:nicotinamidase-related amidase